MSAGELFLAVAAGTVFGYLLLPLIAWIVIGIAAGFIWVGAALVEWGNRATQSRRRGRR